METVNVHDAKTHFSKLVPIERKIKERLPGIANGAVTDAFFEPLPEEELDHWE